MLTELLNPTVLARLQFAFTISFHIIFPAFTIGLASFLAVVEFFWLKTQNPRYLNIYKFWIKIFAIAFGMGVVSGVVMSYQFGTNWSIFSDKTANILGPLLGFEVLTAFFLEASFLGIMLFGWGRVSRLMHFFATCIVAVGTLISAFWILAANSWMQTPQGFTLAANGILQPVNWLAIIFNPSFPYRFVHMVLAAYLTTAFIVGGVGSWYLLGKRHLSEAKVMLGMATLMITLVVPLQIIVGDLHGLNTFHYQPRKVAAMEGIWHTETSAPLRLFAIPDQEQQKNHFEITVPKLASLILTHQLNGTIKGLSTWSKQDQPPVIIVFWAFRIMVGLGILMLCLAIVSVIQYWRRSLFVSRWLHRCWLFMMPSGFIALLSGWIVTEVGRQPYVAYGILRTTDAVSPAITSTAATWSLLSFVIIYTFIFGASSYYILKLIRKGIPAQKEPMPTEFYRYSTEAAILGDSKLANASSQTHELKKVKHFNSFDKQGKKHV